jgi:hypothetical protein
MNLSVQCECGKQLPVSATSAGSEASCSCGLRISIPTLSELRRNAGLNPIPLNTVETIQKLIRSNALPNEKTCPISGRIADTVVYFRVECESTWVKGREPLSVKWVVVYVLFFGWLGKLLATIRNDTPREELGRDVSVDVPIKVSEETLSRVLKMTAQRKLKKILKTNPIYAKLLSEYPRAVVSVIGKT